MKEYPSARFGIARFGINYFLPARDICLGRTIRGELSHRAMHQTRLGGILLGDVVKLGLLIGRQFRPHRSKRPQRFLTNGYVGIVGKLQEKSVRFAASSDKPTIASARKLGAYFVSDAASASTANRTPSVSVHK